MCFKQALLSYCFPLNNILEESKAIMIERQLINGHLEYAENND